MGLSEHKIESIIHDWICGCGKGQACSERDACREAAEQIMETHEAEVAALRDFQDQVTRRLQELGVPATASWEAAFDYLDREAIARGVALERIETLASAYADRFPTDQIAKIARDALA